MRTVLLLASLAAASISAGAAAPGPTPAPSADSSSGGAYRRLSVRCSAQPLPLDALLTDQGFRADLEVLTEAEQLDLRDYAVCRALQGAPAACDSLTDPKQCRIDAAEHRFLFTLLRGGDALSACRDQLALEGKRGPAVEKNCAALIALIRADGGAPSCESLGRALGSQEGCEEIRIRYWGDLRACARLKKLSERRDCLPLAALAAGLRDGAQCSSSPACSALAAKAPSACDPLRAAFSRALCGRVPVALAAESAREARERDAQRLKARAQLDAAAAAAAAERAKTEAAIAAAKAKEAVVRAKVEKLAAAQAARKAASEAAVRAKAEAEEKKAAAAKAKIAREGKAQFRKGEPMQTTPPEALEIIKALEEGRPLPPPRKRKPVKSPPPGE